MQQVAVKESESLARNRRLTSAMAISFRSTWASRTWFGVINTICAYMCLWPVLTLSKSIYLKMGWWDWQQCLTQPLNRALNSALCTWQTTQWTRRQRLTSRIRTRRPRWRPQIRTMQTLRLTVAMVLQLSNSQKMLSSRSSVYSSYGGNLSKWALIIMKCSLRSRTWSLRLALARSSPFCSAWEAIRTRTLALKFMALMSSLTRNCARGSSRWMSARP